jgi:hypothetical protein
MGVFSPSNHSKFDNHFAIVILYRQPILVAQIGEEKGLFEHEEVGLLFKCLQAFVYVLFWHFSFYLFDALINESFEFFRFDLLIFSPKYSRSDAVVDG